MFRSKGLPVTRWVWLAVCVFVALVLAFATYVLFEKRIDRANEVRFQSYLLADELRQSSDDLTRMARTYVVTGSPIYKERYQAILDIRDGRRPRPEQYQRIYWDLIQASGAAPRPDSQSQVALLALMAAAGFTPDELLKLGQAKGFSDQLTALEFEAMRLRDHAQSDEVLASAQLMLHDRRYHTAKAAIMAPIAEFTELFDQRTLGAVYKAERDADLLRFVFIGLGVLLMGSLVFVNKALNQVMGASVERVHAHITRLGKGDFFTPIEVPPGMETSVLGRLAETQENLQGLEAARAQSNAKLKASEERLALVLMGTQDGFWDWMLDSRELYLSPSWWAMLGYGQEDRPFIKPRWNSFMHPEDQARAVENFAAAVKEGRDSYELEFRLQHRDGSWRHIQARGLIVRDAKGRAVRAAGSNRDITQAKLMEEQIRQLAFYDALTQLPNRRLLHDRLQQALVSAKRSGAYIAVFFMDLDNFKPLNDTHGHEAGDQLLTTAATRLRDVVRDSDTVARVGGDEFVVVVSALPARASEALEQARRLAEKVCEVMSAPYQLSMVAQAQVNIVHHCSCSLGVVLLESGRAGVDDALNWADQAMYLAKKAGGNAVHVYTPER